MLPVLIKLDTERCLKLDFSALARLEKIFGKNIKDWKLGDLSLEDSAKVITEGLRWETLDITIEKIMGIIDKNCDDPIYIRLKSFEAINAAFPEKEKKDEDLEDDVGEDLPEVEQTPVTNGTGK